MYVEFVFYLLFFFGTLSGLSLFVFLFICLKALTLNYFFVRCGPGIEASRQAPGHGAVFCTLNHILRLLRLLFPTSWVLDRRVCLFLQGGKEKKAVPVPTS